MYGLPSSVRIYEGCKTDITFETGCPLTVKEGREWVASLNIKGDSYVSQDKHYEAGETAVSVKMCSSDTLRILQMYLKISALI